MEFMGFADTLPSDDCVPYLAWFPLPRIDSHFNAFKASSVSLKFLLPFDTISLSRSTVVKYNERLQLAWLLLSAMALHPDGQLETIALNVFKTFAGLVIFKHGNQQF